MRSFFSASALVAASVGLAACGSDDGGSSVTTRPPDLTADTLPIDSTPVATIDPANTLAPLAPAVTELETEVLTTVSEVAVSLYSAALAGAEDMKVAVDAFVADPSEETHRAAQQAWLDARPAYVRTEGFRFSNGPIDSGEVNVETFLNAWPLDEVYVDSIIEGTDPIDEETLRAANEAGGERNIATGWHAVEYLLWGIDENPDGPGDRSFEEFTGDGDVPSRMRDYLVVTSEMIITDLGRVLAEWQPDGAHRQELLALKEGAGDRRPLPGEGLRRVLTGIGTLAGGELFGERLAVPYDTKDQEEEHSCFSDNTHVDHNMDAVSVQHIYLGLDADGQEVGTSISDVVAAADAALDEKIRAELDAAVATTAAIPAPFDQAILGADDAPGRVAIKAAMDALDVLTQDLVLAGQKLGLQIGTELP